MELFFDILHALYTMTASITAGFFIGRSQRLKEQIRELKDHIRRLNATYDGDTRESL